MLAINMKNTIVSLLLYLGSFYRLRFAKDFPQLIGLLRGFGHFRKQTEIFYTTAKIKKIGMSEWTPA